MTDPRIAEIEARLALDEHEGSLRHFHGKVRADIRFLLDRVRAQSERIEALEAALGLLAIDDEMHLCLVCREDPYCDGHAQECLIGTLPALGAVL